jgi:hypothetical protein
VAFLAELDDAARRLVYLAPRADDCYVCVVGDTLTDSTMVVEVRDWSKSPSESAFYRVTYSRGDDGRIALGEPEQVEERRTFDPVAEPPVSMARAVLLESLPVHAPPADGLTRGRPVQMLRPGPVYDARTGAKLLDVTDEVCGAIAATAAALGFAVPIDMGHELAASGDGAALYGRIVEVEARPGAGLWGVPEWTASGAALLSEAPGLYYLSPTLLAPPMHPQTGKPMAGRMLHSASLTATPRQDSLESLALSRRNHGAIAPTSKEGRMAGQTGAPAPNQGDTITLSRAEHDALVLARTERDAAKAAAEAAQAETVTLAQRLDAVEARERAAILARTVDDEVRAAESAGRVVPATMRPVLLKLDAADRAIMLAAIPATRSTAPVSSGGTPVDGETATVNMLRMAREKGLTIAQAMAGGAA